MVHRPSRVRTAAATATALLMAACVIGGCGSSTGQGTASAQSGSAASHQGLEGLIIRPAEAAPALALRNYTGRPVSIAAFRGKAVFVTFVYTHCPDVCPLIISSLAAAQRQLGKDASRVRIVAVTVDPRRDTPSDVRAFLAARGATGRVDYLLGTIKQMLPIWKAWKVGVSSGRHQYTNGHTDVVYGITAQGRIAVVYPSDFTPAQIVHDVPLLART